MSARDDYPWASFETWSEGVRYTHTNFSATPGKYVGHVPAVDHRKAEQSVLEMVPALLDEIDRLRARVAELEAIPPHPYHLPWVKVDPNVRALVLKTDVGWVYIGAEPPVPDGPLGQNAWDAFLNIDPVEFDTGDSR
jgi:hypothetical protein